MSIAQQVQFERLVHQVEALVAIVELLELRLSKVEATPYVKQYEDGRISLPVPDNTTLHLPRKNDKH